MGKRVLFLDDDYERYYTLKHNHPDWEIMWVQTVSAFIECARNLHYDEIWLDHDLGYFVPDPQILNAKNFGLPPSNFYG